MCKRFNLPPPVPSSWQVRQSSLPGAPTTNLAGRFRRLDPKWDCGGPGWVRGGSGGAHGVVPAPTVPVILLARSSSIAKDSSMMPSVACLRSPRGFRSRSPSPQGSAKCWLDPVVALLAHLGRQANGARGLERALDQIAAPRLISSRVSLKTPKAPRQCQVLARFRRRAPRSPRSAGKWRAMAGRAH
jgi:hypothetical protein